MRVFFKTTVYYWVFIGLTTISMFGLTQELRERKYPTPPDWRWWTRKLRRDAVAGEREPDGGQAVWRDVTLKNKEVLAKLEDREKEGKGIVEQDEGGIYVPGVGKAGYDITAKSERWRNEYFDVLMAIAMGAENLDNWVMDEERKVAGPKKYMIGPSNPNPKPPPTKGVLPPREEYSKPAMDPPDEYYIKILTTKGFTTGQRNAAAIAYGDWFTYKELPDSALEMYRWAVDIAASGLPEPAATVDTMAGTLRENAPLVTPNIVDAVTALALHHATNNDLASALPIFLSVLRARRAAPTADALPVSPRGIQERQPDPPYTSFLSEAVSPPRRSSGDEPLARGPAAVCEDGRIMNYVGEILFASAPEGDDRQRLAGIGFTRDAVEPAEALAVDRANGLSRSERARCRQCAQVGLSNWEAMAQEMAWREKKKREKGGWFGSGRKEVKGGEQEGRWGVEEKAVNRRIQRLQQLETQELFWANRSPGGGGTFLG